MLNVKSIKKQECEIWKNQNLYANKCEFFFRLQLEERLAQEARERRQEDRRLEDKKPSSEELRSKVSYNDVRKTPVDDRRKDQVQFILGGDK